ncbi:MAG: hypothetical protein ABIA67_03735 [Candidatus Margulisiibacteriota bacterium]
MTKTIYQIFLILLLIYSPAFASSSPSYTVPVYVMGSTGGPVASTAYQVFGSGSGFVVGHKTNTTYVMYEGFTPAAFPALAVLVTSITPSSGYNTGAIDIVDLAGAGFASGATVKFTKSGETDINAANVNVVSSQKITCTFDLTGKSTGNWNVVITNPDTSSGTLPNGFTIKTWASQTLVVNYPNPFNPLTGPTTIIYQLAADTNTAILIFNISHELIYKADFTGGAMGGCAGDNSLTWNGYSAFGEMAANGVYFVRVVDKSSGKVLAKGKIAVSR